ncbi:MAG: class I SAM-dependent methyltransferase [Vampirovibrionales bacterium]|nr:class I SAM-dependent methyltransferase [Vampirovibrionales bacterium]
MAEGSVNLKSKWDEVFRKTKWARYPSEEMIRFVVRNFAHLEDRSQVRFLDLGCGIGTACWYLSREGYTAEGIDGSDTAIETAKQWMASEGLPSQFQVSMMQNLPFPEQRFDCVIDNGSSTSTPLPVIRQILEEVQRVMKPQALYYGMFLGSETTISGVTNPKSDDPAFYEEVTDGPLKRAATVRLLREEELRQLFSGFNDVTIDYSLRTLGNREERVQYWHVVARK